MKATLMPSFAVLFFSGALMLAGCSGNARKVHPASTNLQARVQGQLPYNPLAWKPITTFANAHASTASTLYGNDAAVTYARTTAGSAYPAGAVLALVTWQQRDDPHWFGARIPGAPQSVEFVTIGAQPEYALYRGSPLAHVDVAAKEAAARIDALTHERAAVMP